MSVRFLPDEPLPPYAFVPGRFPHPTSDPAGHSFGKQPEHMTIPEPEQWRECAAYLRGVDLFNHGFYWEAHEAWEGLWHACGRRGPMADFFKALIQLAAAGVKAREGLPGGFAGHARRAAELLANFRKECPQATKYFGLDVQTLRGLVEELADHRPENVGDGDFRVGFSLEPC